MYFITVLFIPLDILLGTYVTLAIGNFENLPDSGYDVQFEITRMIRKVFELVIVIKQNLNMHF
jgi:hypothetical protein